MTVDGGRQEAQTGAHSPLEYCAWWRTTVVREREVVDAQVRPDHVGPSPQLSAALDRWPGPHYWADGDGLGRLVLIRSLAPAPPERWWLHTLLFLVTFGTVWMGGSLLTGTPWLAQPLMGLNAVPIQAWFSELVTNRAGLDFAMALMAILLAHETGHYIVAKRYGINASPPYFLPAPPWWFTIGTFGAFIRLRSPVIDRRQLLDVGAAGPWAGFVVAIVALLVGLSRSHLLPDGGPTGQLIVFGAHEIYLGDSLMMYVVRLLFADGATLQLHPLAFAGWIGLFVTMLNLIPLGQLDGGHVLYAVAGRWQGPISLLTWFGLVALGAWGFRTSVWQGSVWLIWAGLILLLSRGRLAHPQVLDRHRPLPRNRQPLAWATVALFVVTFTPIPIHYY